MTSQVIMASTLHLHWNDFHSCQMFCWWYLQSPTVMKPAEEPVNVNLYLRILFISTRTLCDLHCMEYSVSTYSYSRLPTGVNGYKVHTNSLVIRLTLSWGSSSSSSSSPPPSASSSSSSSCIQAKLLGKACWLLWQTFHTLPFFFTIISICWQFTVLISCSAHWPQPMVVIKHTQNVSH